MCLLACGYAAAVKDAATLVHPHMYMHTAICVHYTVLFMSHIEQASPCLSLKNVSPPLHISHPSPPSLHADKGHE